MPTFLTTSKMNPALAARVEASVRGRRGGPRRPLHARRFTSVARLMLTLAIAFTIYGLVTSRRQRPRELDPARTEHGATDGERVSVPRARAR